MRRIAKRFSPSPHDREALERQEATKQEPTPTQAAAIAVERRLEDFLRVGRVLRGGESQGLPHGTVVWTGGQAGVNGESCADGNGIMAWANRFDLNAPGESDGVLRAALVQHVVRDGDAGLLGTR